MALIQLSTDFAQMEMKTKCNFLNITLSVIELPVAVSVTLRYVTCIIFYIRVTGWTMGYSQPPSRVTCCVCVSSHKASLSISLFGYPPQLC